MKKIITFVFLSILIISCSSKIPYKEQIKQYNNSVTEADSFLKNKEYQKAINASTQAIEITDTLSKALQIRGNAYLGLNKYDDAEDDFSDVIKIEGNKSVAYKGRAIAYYSQNKKDDFKDDIDIYISNHGNDNNAHSLRGDYFVEDEKYDEAVNDYSICIKKDPKNPVYYLKRGNVYAVDGQENLSIADYENYTRLNQGKNNDEVYYKRAILNIKVKKYQKALNDFSLISKGYTNLKIFEFKGDCYSKLKNQKNAINQYSLYLEKLPEDSNVINKRGESFLLLGNITSANLDFKRAANIKWVSKGFLYKYGWYVLFIIGFFTIGVITNNTIREEYDNKKAIKSYWYFILTGLFGGHYLYVGYIIRYILYVILVFALVYLNAFNIRSFFNHIDLLWSEVLGTQYSIPLLYAIIILFIIDFIFLPYFVFLKNQELRSSITYEIPKQRGAEIKTNTVLLEENYSKFKSLQL